MYNSQHTFGHSIEQNKDQQMQILTRAYYAFRPIAFDPTRADTFRAVSI